MKTSLSKMIGIIVPVIVVVVVGYGLYLVGSPSAVRANQNDARRLSDLQLISSNVEAYYTQTGQLPSSLGMVRDTLQVALPTDPFANNAYEYQVASTSSYQLCATFEAAPVSSDTKPVNGESLVWKRTAAGRQCFTLKLQQPSYELCDAFHSCGAGETCVVLPGRTTAMCVVAGQECLAAGCGDQKCLISTSYPGKVTCQ